MLGTEERLQEFKEKVGYDQPVSKQDLINALESAIRDRGLYLYFIWKSIQELNPEIDADEIIKNAMHNYGLYKSKNLGDVKNAADGMLNQSSKNGMLVFDQTFVEISEEYSEKHIRNCPLINAFREVGATPEEVTKLCTELILPSELAMLEPYDNVELSFPKNLAEHDLCVMCVKMNK